VVDGARSLGWTKGSAVETARDRIFIINFFYYYSNSVNCVDVSSLRPPLSSEPSVECGVGAALPNGVARCVLDAHPDKQVWALVAMTTLIQQYNAPWSLLEEAVMMSARAQLHGSASPNLSYLAVDGNFAEVSGLIDALMSLFFNFQVNIRVHVVVVSCTSRDSSAVF